MPHCIVVTYTAVWQNVLIMKHIWIIQDSCGKHYNWIELYNSVTLCGSQAVYVPLGEVQNYELDKDSIPIIIGGDDYLQLASKNDLLRRGIWGNSEFFSVSQYIKTWNHDYLNCDTKIVTTENLMYQALPFFIRPLLDDKSIDGQIIRSEHDLQIIRSKCNDDCLFCVSSVKSINKEWRAIIVNRSVVSVCRYAEGYKMSVSKTDVPLELKRFVESHCGIAQAPLVWVMDVAEFNERYYVLECNTFNASNLYDCDRKAIVAAIEKEHN